MLIMRTPAISANENSQLSGFAPDWPAPAGVRAFCAHRGQNLGETHADYRLQADREQLQSHLGITPIWLKQTHSVACVNISNCSVLAPNAGADAAYSCGFNRAPPTACVVLTADCLPILLCSVDGLEIAAVHAGWRGLVAGVIESSLKHFRAAPNQIMAWIGPAISQAAFEVGPEVRNAFLDALPIHADEVKAAFIESTNAGRWLADLYALARLRLGIFGVSQVFGGSFCTHAEPRFHSYRRDGAASGRMATLIWFDATLSR
jgi:polyphenol oxidase